MRWTTVGAVAAVFLMIPSMAAGQPTLVVRTYNNFGVAADDLQIAREEAGAILRDAGIDVIWMDCWFRDREPAGVGRAGLPRRAFGGVRRARLMGT